MLDRYSAYSTSPRMTASNHTVHARAGTLARFSRDTTPRHTPRLLLLVHALLFRFHLSHSRCLWVSTSRDFVVVLLTLLSQMTTRECHTVVDCCHTEDVTLWGFSQFGVSGFRRFRVSAAGRHPELGFAYLRAHARAHHYKT